MKAAWRRRQLQWERFRVWEARQRVTELSPSERLAEVGALVDLSQQVASRRLAVAEDVRASVRGIGLMRSRLAVLSPR